MTVLRLRERVQAGVNLLDQKGPGWDQRIDPHGLNIAHLRCCVLGQLFGDYGLGLFKLNLDKKTEIFTSSSSMGKCLGFEGDIPEMEILTHLWREVVENRRIARIVAEMEKDAKAEELVCA